MLCVNGMRSLCIFLSPFFGGRIKFLWIVLVLSFNRWVYNAAMNVRVGHEIADKLEHFGDSESRRPLIMKNGGAHMVVTFTYVGMVYFGGELATWGPEGVIRWKGYFKEEDSSRKW